MCSFCDFSINSIDFFFALQNILADDYVQRQCLDSEFILVMQSGIAESCDSDGCNGASQYGPIAMMIAIPVIVMKILML